jgi:group I intron endonuclease
MPYGVIYLIRNTVTGKAYIGKTTHDFQTRWKQHLRDARYGKWESYFHSAIRKHGEGVFTHQILATAASLAELNRAEIHYIALHQTLNRELGYNCTAGGEGVTMTPEIRAKISAKAMGRKLTPEHRASVSAGLKNSAAFQAAVRGNKFSPEECRKRSERATAQHSSQPEDMQCGFHKLSLP